jgi:DNA-binding NarL/FixJ family response regulator
VGVQPAFRAVIVDDWPLLRAGVALAIADAGGRVVAECTDSVTALSAVRAHQPEVLVLGDHLSTSPEDTRPDLVIRAISVAPGLRCLALVANPSPDEFRGLSAAGVRAVLSRSVDPGELHEALQRVLGGELVVSPVLVTRLFETAESMGGNGSHDAALTAKEREVLRLLAAGRSNAEIAGALFVSPATVKTHLAHIYEKLGVRGRYEALTRAVALGLVG